MDKTLTFNDREDLLSKIVMKKKDIPNATAIIDNLVAYLKRYKKGDKKAMQTVVKLRKKMLSAAAETYIELEEDGMYDAVVAELNVLNHFED